MVICSINIHAASLIVGLSETIEQHKALLGERPLALYIQGSQGCKSCASIEIIGFLSLTQLHVKYILAL